MNWVQVVVSILLAVLAAKHFNTGEYSWAVTFLWISALNLSVAL